MTRQAQPTEETAVNETDPKCPWCGSETEWVPRRYGGGPDLCCRDWLRCGWVRGGLFLR